ncbi:hypothetical protein N7495_002882 [Penicillium taxi]|uniref:uncharacterized protein n=1 Tax=Penicillium taxi TaxID=168475 RepID=UPI002545743E|nr:uncharacterized protein N7495_002882 [Penicillium taxi]KAJ5902354.1 hypothetical protein N7495_002882 [Penicillium taxi]
MSLPSCTRQLLTGALSKSRSLPVRLSSSSRLYSTGPKPPPKKDSDFKILPILALIGISSGSYLLLVKSRTGQTPGPK